MRRSTSNAGSLAGWLPYWRRLSTMLFSSVLFIILLLSVNDSVSLSPFQVSPLRAYLGRSPGLSAHWPDKHPSAVVGPATGLILRRGPSAEGLAFIRLPDFTRSTGNLTALPCRAESVLHPYSQRWRIEEQITHCHRGLINRASGPILSTFTRCRASRLPKNWEYFAAV